MIIRMVRMCKVVFMNLRQLVKSMLYRINNNIGWREIVFSAVDTMSGSVHSWPLSELGALVEDSGENLDGFLKRNSLVELGFIFVR